MKLLLGAAAAAALFASAPAFAQTFGTTQAYGNIGYSALSGGGEDDDTTLNAVTGRIGARFGPYFGVEGQASFGLGSEEVQFVDGGVIESAELNLENEVSAYLVGFLPLSPNVDLIGRIGFARTEIGAEYAGFEESADGTGIAIGVGGQYYFDGVNGIRLDYTRQEFDEDNEDAEIQGGELDTFTVSYTRRF